MDIGFRSLQRNDLALLGEWLAKDHVALWWPDESDFASLENQYGPVVDRLDPTEVFVVLLGDRPIGLVQRYLIEDNPDWKRSLQVVDIPVAAVGIDYLIGEEELTGQGIGPQMIASFVGETWIRHRSSTAVVVGVSEANRRSWRALEKSGFKRIWSGLLDSEDPSDNGPQFVYLLSRPLALRGRPGD